MTPLTGLGAVIVLVTIAMILLLHRPWAPLPLLFGTFYMTLSQGIEVGPFNVFAIRVLLVTGIVRVVLRQETISGGLNGIDRLMIGWAVWATVCVVFRDQPLTALKRNLGIIFNACGSYFLLRTFCKSHADAVRVCTITVLLLVPVAIEMYSEHLSAHNAFSVLGSVPEYSQVREGRLRAQGPFAHAILAGTVGAICLPLAIGLWKFHPLTSIAGIAACLTMVFTSASSGPVMSAVFAVFALLMWPLRAHMRSVRWLVILVWLGMSAAMNAPIYYLIARIDIAGGSTGWYRARLIEMAIEHIGEWWLAGTDRTRHWMLTGLDTQHADITNQYIHMGVTGGLVLMTLFILILATGFSHVGAAIKIPALTASRQTPFFVWALGASLFAHTTTFVSVSYFDQSFVFLYLTLAVIAAGGTTVEIVVAKPAQAASGGAIGLSRSAHKPVR
jgi:hypothetical protein